MTVALFFVLIGLLVALAIVKGRRRQRLWRWVVRPLFWVWVVSGVAWLALSPVWHAGDFGDEEETFEVSTIQNYRADFTLRSNGDLDVTEQVRVYFPVPRHGIFRFFDIVDPSAPHARRIPEDIQVLRDGQSEHWQESSRNDGRFRVIRIGDAAVEIEDEHEYTIRYRIAGAVEPGTMGERSQFYWNLVPGGWTMPIAHTALDVTLPVASSQHVRCAVGVAATDGCEVQGAGTRHLRIETGPLPERTPVTVKAGLDLAPPPAGHERWWTQPWDGVFGPWSKDAAPTGLGVVAVLPALTGFAGWRQRRQVVEREPAFPVMYAPPAGIGPAQAAFILDESVSRTQFVATLLHLAQRSVITLDSKDGVWEIGSGPGSLSSVDDVSQKALSHLSVRAGKPVKLTGKVGTGKQLQTTETEFLAVPRKWALEQRLMEEVSGVGKAGTLAVLSLILAFTLAAFGFGMSVLCVIPLAYALPALGVIRTGASTRRTEASRRLWSEAGGFKRMLSTPSSEQRFDFSARKDLYTAFIPWAVAFGVADKWAEKYRLETGETPPIPSYVGGTHEQRQEWLAGNEAGSIGSAVEASFAAAVGSAIGAYMASIAPPASSSSSSSSWSSSSSGGGFSGGGGGGGGGGGSW
jgi:uncharacterized membrane protein YgcG